MLSDLLGGEKAAPPCLFLLFGATGDLTARKIAPALYNLAAEGQLHENFAVLGCGRTDWNDETFRREMVEVVKKHSRTPLRGELWEAFARKWHYQRVDVSQPEQCEALAARAAALEARHGTGGNRLAYLAMAPAFFAPIAEMLGAAGLNRPGAGGAFARLVIEKPFGHDLVSAEALNETLRKHFAEAQIFRIDHYLGKETVQNLLVFRFANALFDPHLNYQYVHNVQITTAEPFGMEGRRGAYYDQAGALRDMIQNHMLQLLALLAMDRPDCLHCEAVRDAKVRLLQSIRPLTPQQVVRRTVRGQYVGGAGMRAYREEPGVAPDSQTETYAAVRLSIDNLRWRGVPFYLRTGKRLAAKASQIVVTFQREPRDLFRELGCDLRGANHLMIHITPHEGISLGFDAKAPGAGMLLRPVHMDFQYDTTFASASPEAYEHLVRDAIAGEATLFLRADEVAAAWRVIDSIRTVWDTEAAPPLAPYAPGSWGPAQADALFENPYMGWCPLVL